jgi:hypothetical protein
MSKGKATKKKKKKIAGNNGCHKNSCGLNAVWEADGHLKNIFGNTCDCA